MKSIIFCVVLALAFATTMAQCPCSFNEGRTCNTTVARPGFSSKCDVIEQPCECFCDYGVSPNRGICNLDVIGGYVITNPQDGSCEQADILVPQCAADGVSVTREYVCTDGSTLYSAGTIVCTMESLPCYAITDVRFEYTQFVQYDAVVSYLGGVGKGSFRAQTFNTPLSPFVGSMPGTLLEATGIEVDGTEGLASKVISFNTTEVFNTDAKLAYLSTLQANCGKPNSVTTFNIELAFAVTTSTLNFDTSEPYGVRSKTDITVLVTQLEPKP